MSYFELQPGLPTPSGQISDLPYVLDTGQEFCLTVQGRLQEFRACGIFDVLNLYLPNHLWL